MRANKKPTTLVLIEALRHDVNEIKGTMATKDDIKDMATKDDIKFLVSYVDDFKWTITADFEAVRRDVDGMKNRFEGVVQAVIKNSADIEHLQQTVATKADIETILDRINSFTKKVEVVERKGWVHDHRLNELEPRMDNCEKRLSALESNP